MKKLMIAVAIACAAVAVNAAQVGWNMMGLADYKADKYLFFIDGQNGASIAAVTAALDAGTSADAMAFGSGTVNASGMTMQGATTSGKTLGEGTYTGFFVLFDAAAPTTRESKYTVLSGAATLTQTIGAQTATATFNGGQGTSIMGEWKTFGGSAPVPEPTGAMLMLLGMAGLALKRRRM